MSPSLWAQLQPFANLIPGLIPDGWLCIYILPTDHIMCIFRVVLLPFLIRHLIVSFPRTW